MADTGGKRITDTFRFKHHAIPVPKISAANRIIDATTRLTAVIAGIQDTPPDKMEAIQSLRTLLLGKVALLPPPTPSILPTPPPRTSLVDEDKLVIIWNSQLVQPSLPTHNHNINGINSNRNNPAITDDESDDNSPNPSHSTCPPHHHLIRPLQNRPLTRNQLRLCTAYVINCIIAEELMSITSLWTCPLHFIADMSLQLKASSWKQSLHPLTPPFTSTAPLLTGNVLKY
jgi:hypothetical protein